MNDEMTNKKILELAAQLDEAIAAARAPGAENKDRFLADHVTAATELRKANLGWQRNKECLRELISALARETNLLREWHKALRRAERAEQRCKLKRK